MWLREFAIFTGFSTTGSSADFIRSITRNFSNFNHGVIISQIQFSKANVWIFDRADVYANSGVAFLFLTRRIG
jgi:hypothetical protein